MTIHKHSLSSKDLAALTPLSRSTSSDAASNGGSSGPATRTQSTASLASLTSLASVLSSLTTPDYSPQLIDTEVGDLLNIDDLELGASDELPDDCSEEVGSVSSSTTTEADGPANGPDHCRGIDDLLCGCVSEDAHVLSRYDPKLHDYHEKWFVCLIGLPACGKSTVVKQLIDFAKVKTGATGGVRIASFNAGDVRRKYEASKKSKFSFDLQDNSAQKEREKYAFEALKELTDSLLADKVDVGILDATNTTRARREAVFHQVHKVSKESGVPIRTLILEVRCNNKSLRRFNIEQKANNRDYKGSPKDQAIIDFLKRIEKYESIYERVTVGEIAKLGAKYFSITNAGDCICYDCGLAHHDSQCHQHLQFRSVCPTLLYDFLMTYRCNYALPYLQQVDDFYMKGGYKPVVTNFGKVASATGKLTPLMKVLSAPRCTL